MYTYHIVYKDIFILILNYEIAIVLLHDMLVLVQAEIFCLGNYHPGVKKQLLKLNIVFRQNTVM